VGSQERWLSPGHIGYDVPKPINEEGATMPVVYAEEREKARELLVEMMGQHSEELLPLLELVQELRVTLDDVFEVVGRVCVERVLELSAEQVAGERHQGKAGGKIGWHGTQEGVVTLSTEKIRVRKPRLRQKRGGKGAEVRIPAYEAMQQDAGLRAKLATAMLRGVSTRNYAEVVPKMAECCGIGRSSVSREFIEASEEALKRLCERRFDEVDLLIVYIDGVQYSGHHVIVAIGVDRDGYKHVLGLADGATENAVVVKGLLEDLEERGVSPGRRRLFVIDGSKALRSAIDAVYGEENAVQRCRHHKIENVTGHLPKHLKDQVKLVMKAAYRLPDEKGLSKLREQAAWLESQYPSAAASLREGLEETFTINRLGLPAALRRCLGTTNLVESPNAGMRLRTRRVTRWRDGKMILRWAAAAYLETEKNFRRIMGYESLWVLESALSEEQHASDGPPPAGHPVEDESTAVTDKVEAEPAPLPAVA
jgi:transposase-like protein